MMKVVFTGVMLIVFISLVGVLGESVAIKYEDVSTTANEEYTATGSVAVSEILELTYSYDSINFITVDGTEIDLETDIDTGASDSDTIVLEEAASVVPNPIVVNYEHLVSTEIELYSTPVRSIINMLPLVAIAGVLVFLAGAAYLKSRG